MFRCLIINQSGKFSSSVFDTTKILESCQRIQLSSVKFQYIENQKLMAVHRVKYFANETRLLLPVVVGSPIITQFASTLNFWKSKRQYFRPLIIDFSAVQKPYSNGMLPIIALLTKLRAEGQVIKIILPNDRSIAELFVRTNWAFYLDPVFGKSKAGFDRHLHTRQIMDYRDVGTITNDFMAIVLRSMVIPKDIVSALEWSIYEICDNVINHAESSVGGFVEAVTYTKEKRICFTIADAGRGVLNSLKEGLPHLKSNVEAIGEAIKEGVTRNKQFGQGNGLNGSLRITTMSGGSIDITSGAGRLVCTSQHTNPSEALPNEFFKGTSVSGQILMSDTFSIGKALAFGGKEYIPLNIIDLKYEAQDADVLNIKVAIEAFGVGTRSAGRQLNLFALNLMSAKPGYPIVINWENIDVISSSFADEFLGKLFVEIGQEKFNKTIKNINMNKLIQQLVEKGISQRIEQAKR